MNTKIKVVRGRTPEEIARITEEELLKLNGFSSPIIQDRITNQFISFVYYKSSDKIEEPKFPEKKAYKEYKPTQDQIESWKEIKPTFKTIELLKKKGFIDKELKEIKTQYEAYIIIENLKGDNI